MADPSLRIAWSVVFFSLTLPVYGAEPYFTNVTREAGINFINQAGNSDKKYIIETQAAGGGFCDFDQDGRLDLYLTGGVRADSAESTAFYRNLGHGVYANETGRSDTGLYGWNMGMACADYDADGDPDLYVTRWGPDVLLANGSDGVFTDVTASANLGSEGWGTGAAFADYDRDGDLDFYVANYIDFVPDGPPFYDRWCTHNGIPSACGPAGARAQPDILYRNQGDGTFGDVSAIMGLRGRDYYGMGAAWSDLDRDGDLDLYVANDGQPNSLWRNDGRRFIDIALATGTAYSGDGRPQAGMGVALADFDNDLQVDIFVTNFAQDYNTLYRSESPGFFVDISGSAGLAGSSRPFMGWGTLFFDCDQDGWQDLLVANGHLMPAIDRSGSGLRYRQRNQLYRNLGGGRFREAAPAGALAEAEISRGAAAGDYDSDGDLDLLFANLDAAPALLRNDTEAPGHWLLLHMRQDATEAIGARVQVTAAGRHQLREVQTGASFQSQSDTRLHFGIGSAPVADIAVTWPDGQRQLYRSVPANRRYLIDQGADRPLSE